MQIAIIFWLEIHHSLWLALIPQYIVLVLSVIRSSCYYFIMVFTMMVVTMVRIFMAIIYFLDYTFRLSVTKQFWFCKCVTPWMLLPLDISLQYWSEQVIFRLLYVMLTFPTRIFYRGVADFATDCPCRVWCHGLTNYPLYVGPFFRNLV